ncbi:MAG: NTP transferase domain-containing protein, partial [Candidatus Eisenbacteria bacterium]|nr:NTP transferase domain-containing protein [Candidatus Eisenbacteria bacterium]
TVAGDAGTDEGNAVTGRVIPVINHEPEKGRLHSVRLGLAALTASTTPASDWKAILILNVDQPRSAPLLRRLAEAHFNLAHEITGPTHQGRHGHPVIFARVLRNEILAASEQAEGLRAVVRSDPARVTWWPTDDPTVLLDLNTPDDYSRAAPETR